MKKEAPGGRPRIDAFRETLEVNPARLEPGHQIHQAFDTAPEPIELPDGERIACAQVREHLNQPRSVRAHAA